MTLKFEPPPTRNQIIARDPLGRFLVFWLDLRTNHVLAFARRLQSAGHESDIQAHLERAPMLLAQVVGGGHGRWVIPKKRLGSEYVTDFLVGEKDSLGFHWVAVELESPLVRMFTRNGAPSAALTHAVRQIQDWRVWLKSNQNYAARPSAESGLGLTDIDSEIPGLILIGRRSDLAASTTALRRRMSEELNIEIHSYDYLIDLSSSNSTWTTTRSRSKSRA